MVDVKFEVDAGEGDAIAGLIHGGCPGVVGLAAAAFDALGVLGNEDVFFEAVEFLVVGEFIGAVKVFGTLGEDFGDEFGVAFDVAIGPIAGIAGNKGIGIVVKVFGVVHFDIAIVEATIYVITEVDVDEAKQVNRNAGVVTAATGHSVDETMVVFVAGGAVAIDDQVFIGGDVVGDGDHGSHFNRTMVYFCSHFISNLWVVPHDSGHRYTSRNTIDNCSPRSPPPPDHPSPGMVELHSIGSRLQVGSPRRIFELHSTRSRLQVGSPRGIFE